MIAPALLALVAFASPAAQGGAPDIPTQEFLGWRGWTYLAGAAPAVANLYPSTADPTAPAPPALTADAVTWRVKVVVFRSVERVGRDTAGILRSDRETIEDVQFGPLKASLQRLAANVQAASAGKIKLDVNIEEEAETMRGEMGQEAFGAPFLRHYLGARLNGGGYDAEDKVYRGPYPSVICVIPGTITPRENTFDLYGMPVTVTALDRLDLPTAPIVVDATLRAIWTSQLERRAIARGYAGVVGDAAKTDDLSELVDLSEPTGATLVTRATNPSRLRVPAALLEPVSLGSSWRSPIGEATVVTDPDKGSVLKVAMKGRTRGGAITLPIRADGQPLSKISEVPTLNLSLRTLSKDPIAIRLEGKDGHRGWIVLGPEFARKDDPKAAIVAAPVVADGTWQKVAVDLKPLGQAAGIDEITSLAFEFSPRARQYARAQTESIDLFLDDIHFSGDTPAAVAPTLSESEQKARTAVEATASSPDLVALLADKSSLVRLNSADAFTRFKDPTAETGLISVALGMD